MKPTAILKGCGFLPKKFSDDLLGYFYQPRFGGVYEDMHISGVEMLFPKCDMKQTAILRVNLSESDVQLSALVKLLRGFRFDVGRDIQIEQFANQLRGAGFDEIRHNVTRAVNFMGTRLGFTWSFYLRFDGRLLAIEAHDIPLVAANAEDRTFTEERIRMLLIQQLKTSTLVQCAGPVPELTPSTPKRGLKRGPSETTKRLLGCGFLPKSFNQELIGDFFIEGFDGLYEDLVIGGVQLLFPKCASQSVAALRCDLECEELDLMGFAKVLEAYGFEVGSDFTRMNYQPDLRDVGFEPVLHETSGTVNFVGDRHGLTWTFRLREDGTLLYVEAHDVPLVASNAARMTECEVRNTLVQWLRTSAQ